MPHVLTCCAAWVAVTPRWRPTIARSPSPPTRSSDGTCAAASPSWEGRGLSHAEKSGHSHHLRCNLEDHPIAVRRSGLRRAVKVAISVENQAAKGFASVVAAGEVVKIGIAPAPAGRRQFEDITRPIGAVADRRAVEIAQAVHNQAASRPTTSAKGVK